MVAYLAA